MREVDRVLAFEALDKQLFFAGVAFQDGVEVVYSPGIVDAVESHQHLPVDTRGGGRPGSRRKSSKRVCIYVERIKTKLPRSYHVKSAEREHMSRTFEARIHMYELYTYE